MDRMDRLSLKEDLLGMIDKQITNEKEHAVGVACVEILLGFLDDVHNISTSMKELVNIQRTKR